MLLLLDVDDIDIIINVKAVLAFLSFEIVQAERTEFKPLRGANPNPKKLK